MKCPTCRSPAAYGDSRCFNCGTDLTLARGVLPPVWSWPLCGLCFLIPVITVGGAIPMGIAAMGAGGVASMARSYRIPAPLRFIGCVGATMLCWLVGLPFIGLALVG